MLLVGTSNRHRLPPHRPVLAPEKRSTTRAPSFPHSPQVTLCTILKHLAAEAPIAEDIVTKLPEAFKALSAALASCATAPNPALVEAASTAARSLLAAAHDCPAGLVACVRSGLPSQLLAAGRSLDKPSSSDEEAAHGKDEAAHVAVILCLVRAGPASPPPAGVSAQRRLLACA